MCKYEMGMHSCTCFVHFCMLWIHCVARPWAHGLVFSVPPRKNPSVLPSEYADILPKHGPSLRGAQKHRSSVRSVDIYHNVVTLDYRWSHSHFISLTLMSLNFTRSILLPKFHPLTGGAGSKIFQALQWEDLRSKKISDKERGRPPRYDEHQNARCKSQPAGFSSEMWKDMCNWLQTIFFSYSCMFWALLGAKYKEDDWACEEVWAKCGHMQTKDG